MVQELTREGKYRGSDIPLAFWRVRSHPSYPMHRHEFQELVVVLKGTGIHVTEQGKTPIQAGDVFVVHRQHTHAYEETRDLHLVDILFDMKELGLPVGDIGTLPGFVALFEIEPSARQQTPMAPSMRLNKAQLRDLTLLIDELEHEFQHRQPGWGCAAIGTFMRLITELSRMHSGIDVSGADPSLRLDLVLSYMDEHYQRTFSLAALAQLVNMSVRTFTRRFRELKGCAPGEYIARLRMARAGRLLRSTNRSITDIAFEVGFNDSNYFARQFRRLMGCSPREYRKED